MNHCRQIARLKNRVLRLEWALFELAERDLPVFFADRTVTEDVEAALGKSRMAQLQKEVGP